MTRAKQTSSLNVPAAVRSRRRRTPSGSNPPVTNPPAPDKVAPALTGLKFGKLVSGKKAKLTFKLTEAAKLLAPAAPTR